MKTEDYIAILKSEVERKFGRRLDSPADFDMLTIAVDDMLHNRISSSTLKRMFGYIESSSAPSHTSLNIMARYVGYNDWDDFMEQNSHQQSEPQKSEHPAHIVEPIAQETQQERDTHTTVRVAENPVRYKMPKKLLCGIIALFVVTVTVVYLVGRYQSNMESKDIKTSQQARPKDMNDPNNVELFRRGDLLFRRWFKSKYSVTVECMNKNVTEVTIPDSVTYNDSTYHVGELSFDCFRDCKHLKRVNIINCDCHLQNGAFKGCDSLQVISLGSNIPPRIGNGGWPASIPEIFDEHHFEDVTLYLTPYLYKHQREFPAWGEFIHAKPCNPEPPKKKK